MRNSLYNYLSISDIIFLSKLSSQKINTFTKPFVVKRIYYQAMHNLVLGIILNLLYTMKTCQSQQHSFHRLRYSPGIGFQCPFGRRRFVWFLCTIEVQIRYHIIMIYDFQQLSVQMVLVWCKKGGGQDCGQMRGGVRGGLAVMLDPSLHSQAAGLLPSALTEAISRNSFRLQS